MKVFEKIMQKPWLLYVIVFILLLAVGLLLRRCDPRGVPWTDNLWQSSLMALGLAIGFAIGDRHRRKNKEHQEEIMKRLKDKEQWN